MKDVESCPICGGAARLRRESDNRNEEGSIFYVMVECDTCGTRGPKKEVSSYDVWNDWDRLEEAVETEMCISAWNTRSIPVNISINEIVSEKIAACMEDYIRERVEERFREH